MFQYTIVCAPESGCKLRAYKCHFLPWLEYLNKVLGQCALSPWTMARMAVHEQCPQGPWTMSTESWTMSTESMGNVQLSIGMKLTGLDKVQPGCGQRPLGPWTVSNESMKIVHWVCGHCLAGVLEWSPWTMCSQSINNVNWIHGQCPWTQWTLSMGFLDNIQFTQTPLTLSRVSMDIVHTEHWIHGQCPGSPWEISMVPWTMSRESAEGYKSSSEFGFKALR